MYLEIFTYPKQRTLTLLLNVICTVLLKYLGCQQVFLVYAYKLCIIKKSSLRPIASISSTALIYFPCIFDSCICGQFDPSLNTDLAEQKESYFIYFIFHIIGIIFNKYIKKEIKT